MCAFGVYALQSSSSKGVDTVFKVGGFVTTAREARENFWSYYVQNIKNALKSAISTNYISNLLHIFGYPTMITVSTARISSNFDNPINSI